MLQHIARRGLEYGPALLKRAREEQPQIQMPTWGAVLLIVTFVVSMVAISLVRRQSYAALSFEESLLTHPTGPVHTYRCPAHTRHG